MQIPPQEDWSPELLSELQRAVPVLESTSFELGGTPTPPLEFAGLRGITSSQDAIVSGLSLAAASSRTSVGPSDGGARWRGWATAGGGLALQRRTSGEVVPTDPLSDDAMALPRSTLTSGKRRTYPNRSTFQAHVCCVMDPLQVPNVLEMLQEGPHLKSVRSWPYAYRIISPFDGQVHECCDDSADPGAGEKILGLLTRMGLENLLLIVSRWDTGPTDRLGTELFKCINEQCKDLLRELQQAVRASFPPEELLGARVESSSPSAVGRRMTEELAELFAFSDGGVGGEDRSWSEPGSDCFADMYHVGIRGQVLCPGADPVDLDALGPRPPSELVFSARGVCALPMRPRGRPDAAAAAPRPTGARSARGPTRPRKEDPASLRAAFANEVGAGLRVRRCELAERGSDVHISSTLVEAGSQDSDMLESALGSKQKLERLVSHSGGDHAYDTAGCFLTETPLEMDAGGLPIRKRAENMERSSALTRMTSEELLRISAQLRTERTGLESVLKEHGCEGGGLKRLQDQLAKDVGEVRRQIIVGRARSRGKALKAAGAMTARPSPRLKPPSK